jgi:hypothetical protein
MCKSGVFKMSVDRNNVELAAVRLPAVRARVETAMLEIISQLQREGFSVEEIALSLADASEDYVILLAKEKRSTH